MVVSRDDIQEGFAHLERFAAIHYGSDPHEASAALHTLGEYLGMDEDAMVAIVEGAYGYVPEDRLEAARWVIMGFFIGMTTVNRALESG